MLTGITDSQIEHLLADGLFFAHRGRAVRTFMVFDEPERVTLIPVDHSDRVLMRWDALMDMVHANEAGYDVGDLWGSPAC